MKKHVGSSNYQATVRACFVGYIVQAIVNGFTPLLLVAFQTQYDISMAQNTLIVTVNFCTQLTVDFAAIFFVDKLGYRVTAMLAHGFSATGLILLAILPNSMKNSFAGIIIAVVTYAVGGGLIEVIISPIVEACPSEHKEKAMSILHSFYCWGCVGMIALSTLFFRTVGINHWRILALIWAAIPILNCINFVRVPISHLIQGGQKGSSMKELLARPIFWLFLVIMVCSGASEAGMAAWSSAFTERALGIPKSIGDFAGPMLFVALQGCSRALYGKLGDRFNLRRMMALSGGICAGSYLVAAMSASPVICLLGLISCGFFVGILWPGTFSSAASSIQNGGTTMFALMALAGDLGCTAGSSIVGLVASVADDNLKKGLLSATIFPVVLVLCTVALNKEQNRNIC